MLHLLVIDDDKSVCQIFRDTVRIFFKESCFVTLVSSLKQGVKEVQKSNPDIVFIDFVQTDGSGINLIKSTFSQKPYIVFITANKEDAHQAIKFEPEDFLFKPVISEDIISVIQKIILKMKRKMNDHSDDFYLARIVIPTNETVYQIKKEKIIRCESCGNYSIFIIEDNKKIVSSYPMKHYEKQLSYPGFIRIHQSHIVNTNFIDHFEKQKMELVLTNNFRLPVSSRKKADLLAYFDEITRKNLENNKVFTDF